MVALPCSQISDTHAGVHSKAGLLSLGITPGCQLMATLREVASDIGDTWLLQNRGAEFVLSDASVAVRRA